MRNVAFGQLRQSCEWMKLKWGANLTKANRGWLTDGDTAALYAAQFCGRVNTVNQWMRDGFLRKLVRLPAEPNCLAGFCLAHWNGLAMQTNNEHRPLVVVKATQLRHVIVGEMSGRKAFATE